MHEDLDLVGEPLGDDLVDQQRRLVEQLGLAGHALGVGLGHEAHAAGFGVGEQVAALEFGLAVDDLGLRVRFGVLDGGFLARFGFQLALLNLLFLERQGVLHGVGLSLGFDHLGLRLSLGLFHLLHGLSLGLQLGNLHLLLLNVGHYAELVVLLLLEQQAFEALGILVGELNVAEHDFLNDDAIGAELAGDDGCGPERTSSRLVEKISRTVYSGASSRQALATTGGTSSLSTGWGICACTLSSLLGSRR